MTKGTKKKDKDSKINILAMNRKSKLCMETLIPDDGHVFVASDCNAIEPTMLLNFCDDATLYKILFAMRGKEPYWDRGVLLTDSLYVTTMSNTPLLGPLLEKLGDEWRALWAVDPDAAKKQLGPIYATSKMVVLALLYGLQKKSLARHLVESGVVMTDKEVSQIYEGFWDSLPEAKMLKDFLIHEFKAAHKKGQCFVSPMGFPLPTSKPSDALNYCVQSSVSSWLRKLNRKLFSDKRFFLNVIIHDELVVSVRKEDVNEYREWLELCRNETNEFFQLPYPVKLGFNVAEDFYGIK